MSNKTKAVVILLNYTQNEAFSSIQSKHFDNLITQGNSTLLVLRNESIENEVSLFNTISSISQVEGTLNKEDPNDTQSVIERNFFKRTLQTGTFNEFFHNGGFSYVTLLSNSENVLKQGEKYGMQISDKINEVNHKILESDLTIIFINDPSNEQLEQLLDDINSCESAHAPVIKYLGIAPFPIQRHHLQPKQPESQMLQEIIPKQTYLNYASKSLDFENDICHSKAILMIENDLEYQRIDKYQSLDEIREKLSQCECSPFLYKYQLADSFMKQVAFKLGKLEKFGA